MVDLSRILAQYPPPCLKDGCAYVELGRYQRRDVERCHWPVEPLGVADRHKLALETARANDSPLWVRLHFCDTRFRLSSQLPLDYLSPSRREVAKSQFVAVLETSVYSL